MKSKTITYILLCTLLFAGMVVVTTKALNDGYVSFGVMFKYSNYSEETEYYAEDEIENALYQIEQDGDRRRRFRRDR